MSAGSGTLGALEAHVRGFWAGHLVQPATWTRGPIRQRVPEFVTYRVAPLRAGGAWVYVTTGCSLAANGHGAEFFLLAPWPDEAHSETLAMVAHLHSYEAHRLGVGSIVDIGRPWLPDSPMDHLLVSLPYPYGPRLERAPDAAGNARFRWLLPIHRSEAAYVRRKGLEEFEDRMDERAANVLDPNRSAIA